jgi:RND family efflux transporter MFP subunit
LYIPCINKCGMTPKVTNHAVHRVAGGSVRRLLRRADRMTGRPTRLARLVAGLALLALAGCDQQAAPPAKIPTAVRTQVIALTDHTPTVALTGEIIARVQSDLSFRVSGRIIERNVDVGDRVTAEQTLARLDPEEQMANVRAAEAAVQAAEAQLRQASSAFERQKTLLARGFTTRRDYDQAEAAFRTAQASLDAARAQLETARDQLSYTVLRAGAAGIVTARNIEVGQVVQATQSAYRIARDGPRDAVFNVYESILAYQLADPAIKIVLLSDPAVRAAGTIREVAPAIDPSTGTVKVKIGLEQPPAEMTLGAAVTGTARFKPRRVVILPSSALSWQGGRPAVWVVDTQSDTVALRPVAVEAYQTGGLIIREGLREGEVVVTAGAQLLRPDQRVVLAAGAAQ